MREGNKAFHCTRFLFFITVSFLRVTYSGSAVFYAGVLDYGVTYTPSKNPEEQGVLYMCHVSNIIIVFPQFNSFWCV